MENNKKGTFKVPHKIANLDADYGGWSNISEAVNYFDTKGEPGRQFIIEEDNLKVLYIYQGSSVPPTKVGSDISSATSTTAGVVKLSSDSVSNLVPNTISTTANRTYGIQKNDSGQLVVNVPWTGTSYSTGSVTDVYPSSGNPTTNSRVWNGSVLRSFLDEKIDKVSPDKLTYAFIDVGGAIEYEMPPEDEMSYVYGTDANYNPVRSEVMELYVTNNTTTELTAIQLSVITTLEVHCPVINTYYKKLGNDWYKFTGTKVV